MTQALGYAVCEEMLFDEHGRMVNPRFGDYRIFTADEMPEMQVRFVQTYEPTHPVRRQGRGRDPAGRRRAGRRERRLRRHRRADSDHPADAGAGVAGVGGSQAAGWWMSDVMQSGCQALLATGSEST